MLLPPDPVQHILNAPVAALHAPAHGDIVDHWQAAIRDGYDPEALQKNLDTMQTRIADDQRALALKRSRMALTGFMLPPDAP